MLRHTQLGLGAIGALALVCLATSVGGVGPLTPVGGAAADSSEPLTSVPGLDQAALDVMNAPPYTHGQWAISVQDMDTGEQVISLNADTVFEPGSVVKSYSSGAAWLEFGPESTIVTPVKRTAEVAGGVLAGDLILVGKGDLTMGGRTKADGTVDVTNLDHNDANAIPGATLTPEDPLTGLNELAAQVKAAGIDSITGEVIVDNRLWDTHELAGQPITPMIINQNVIDLTTTATTPGQPATAEISPGVSPWTLDVQVQTVAAGGVTKITTGSVDEKTIVLTGTIAADSGPVVNIYTFKDPATFARTAYIEALGRAGVSVAADPLAANPASVLPDYAVVDALPSVAELISLPLQQEATYVLKISYNRGAETFICRLAIAAGKTECTEGITRAAEIWSAAGLNTTTASLIDGSGLDGNLITPNNQVQLQTIMANRSDAALWKATLPILGVDGSLFQVQANSPAKGMVSAKTGTLVSADVFNNRLRMPTKALGGYIDTQGGRRFAFAIMATNSFVADINGVLAANEDVGTVAAIIQQDY